MKISLETFKNRFSSRKNEKSKKQKKFKTFKLNTKCVLRTFYNKKDEMKPA